MENASTYSSKKTKEFTIEDLKKASDLVQGVDRPPLSKGLRWFEKIMNRFGWHRSYTVIFIDKSKLDVWYGFRTVPNMNIKLDSSS